MNKTNFNQTGGFPLKTERLQELQTAFQILNAFGALAGNLTIISGCTTVGSTVKNGFVFIDGELLEFREAGLTGTSRVIIIEEAVNRAFENGTVKTVYTIRYATFGTAATSWLWTDFKKPIETKALVAALFLKADKTTTDNIITRLTNAETKLATIAVGAEVNVASNWNVTDPLSDAYIHNKPVVAVSDILARGSFDIGDSNGTDVMKTVYFTQIDTYDYMIFGSIRSKSASGNWSDDNDVIWTVKPINTFAFELYLREVSSNRQNIAFDYIIVKK
jgi:hypothetical protein